MTIIKSQPTYKRQRFLLDFVKQLSTDATTTDLQKLIFLHTTSGYSSYYDFIPYKYGPYSFQLAEDITILPVCFVLLSKSRSTSERVDPIIAIEANI